MKAGWQVKTLNDLCDIARGGSPRPIKAYLTNDPDGVNWVKISDATASTKYIYKTQQKIKRDGIKRSRLVKKGDFLLSNSMSFGRPYIMQTTGCIHDGWLVLSDKTGMFHQDYLYYFLGSPEAYKQFDARASGSTVRNLNIDLVRSVKVPLPPLPEQERIVAILDEAFAAIDKAAANTEKNLANARELFDSELNRVFSQKGEGWVEKRLGDVCDVRDGTHDSPKYISDGIPFVTQKNITMNGLCLENTKFISQHDHDKFYKRSNVSKGDIIISMIGANRGMSCLVNDERIFSIKNVGLIKACDKLDMNYLLYYLRSSLAKKYIEVSSRGGAQSFIGLTKLRQFPVLLTSLEKQKIISTKLDQVVLNTSNLDFLCREKITALTELKQSILQKAFTGELTADFKAAERTLSEAGV